MSRFFTFGCSYTGYQYPTWADLLICQAKEDNIKGLNAGWSGAGNQYIASRIWEANAKFHFTKDDTIVIMWSNFFREDRYITDYGWNLVGNVFNNKLDVPFQLNNFIYTNEYQYKDINHYLARDCMIITSTIEGLYGTGAKVISTSISNPYVDKTLQELDTNGFLSLYKSWLYPQVEPLNDYNFYDGVAEDTSRPTYFQKEANRIYIEDHPLPLEHLDWLENILAPILDMEIGNVARNYAQTWQDKLYENNGKEYPLPGWHFKKYGWLLE